MELSMALNYELLAFDGNGNIMVTSKKPYGLRSYVKDLYRHINSNSAVDVVLEKDYNGEYIEAVKRILDALLPHYQIDQLETSINRDVDLIMEALESAIQKNNDIIDIEKTNISRIMVTFISPWKRVTDPAYVKCIRFLNLHR